MSVDFAKWVRFNWHDVKAAVAVYDNGSLILVGGGGSMPAEVGAVLTKLVADGWSVPHASSSYDNRRKRGHELDGWAFLFMRDYENGPPDVDALYGLLNLTPRERAAADRKVQNDPVPGEFIGLALN